MPFAYHRAVEAGTRGAGIPGKERGSGVSAATDTFFILLMKDVSWTVGGQLRLLLVASIVALVAVAIVGFAESSALAGRISAIDPAAPGDALAKLRSEASGEGWTVFLVAIVLAAAIGVLSTVVGRRIKGALFASAESLQDGAAQVAAAAGQVATTSQSLANGASVQAASLEQTSASLEQMASMARQNAENLERAKERANSTRQSAESGVREMAQMTEVMASMKGSGAELDKAMEEMKAAGGAISKIIKTIDEIAFQTNILALNAAVEAARAGSAGAGFAVVADEVRNLAGRSAEAARETAHLIEDSISKSDHGVRMSHRVGESLQQIVSTSQKVDQRLGEIVENIRGLDEAVGQVSAASREQSEGVGQIKSAVHQMDEVTQKAASSSQDSASAAEELSAQAAALQEWIERLRAVVGLEGGRDGLATPFAAPPLESPLRGSRRVRATPIGASSHDDIPMDAEAPIAGLPRLHASGRPPVSALPSEDHFKDF